VEKEKKLGCEVKNVQENKKETNKGYATKERTKETQIRKTISFFLVKLLIKIQYVPKDPK